MFQVVQELLPGVRVIQLPYSADPRGAFVKSWHPDLLPGLGFPMDFQEEFFSVSKRNVLRGMHFQIPPHGHDKLVLCVAGEVLDVVLDLRHASPTFGRWATYRMNASESRMLAIPQGLAHGFLSLTDDSILLYKTSAPYSPQHDKGIRWDSFGFQWPVEQPILSPRDQQHPALADFVSPF